MREAFSKAGVTEPLVLDQYSDSWGGWLYSDGYHYADDFYRYHEGVLSMSIGSMLRGQTVVEKDMLQIRTGMQLWSEKEAEIRALLERTVSLYSQRAVVADRWLKYTHGGDNRVGDATYNAFMKELEDRLVPIREATTRVRAISGERLFAAIRGQVAEKQPDQNTESGEALAPSP